MFEDHPLKVNYPHGGCHYLLQYRTHNEGSHIILARSKNSLLYTFKKIIADKNVITDYFKILKLLEIEIFAPPKELCQLAKKVFHKRKINDFCKQVVCYIKDHFSINKLPDEFVQCEFSFKNEEDLDVEATINHYDCENCIEGIKLKNLSEQEFYDLYHINWYSQFPSLKPNEFIVENEKTVYSCAPRTLNDCNLMAAIADFGYHAHGIDIEDIKISHIEILLSRPILFFFKEIAKMNFDSYQEMIDNSIKKIKIKDAQKTSLLRKLVADRKQKEKEKILSIFNSKK